MPVAQASIDMQARPLHALDVCCLGVRVARVRDLALASTINDDADHVGRPTSLGPSRPVNTAVVFLGFLVFPVSACLACLRDSIALESAEDYLVASALRTLGVLADCSETEAVAPFIFPYPENWTYEHFAAG